MQKTEEYTMKKQTITALVALKNEEKNIGRCLESIKWVDEIIIVDNDSTDNTVKIAKKYTNKIFSYKKKALIPKIQQFGIEKATKDWILVLDADVVVTKEATKEIIKKIQEQRYKGYYVPHKMVAFGKPMKYALFCNILKLFRRGYGKFDAGSAHCKLKIKGRIGTLKHCLLHYAHPDIKTFLKKMNLYTSQDAEEIVKKGKGGLLNKKMKRIGVYNLMIEPFLYMNYLYFRKKYFKDGKFGLIISILMGFYLFIERVKVIEKKIKIYGKNQ